MDRVVQLLIHSVQLQRTIDSMTSQIARNAPGRKVPSSHDIINRPPRGRRETQRQQRRRKVSDDNENKENMVTVVHNDNGDEVQYSKCIGNVIDSYLSPLRVRGPVRPSNGWFSNDLGMSGRGNDGNRFRQSALSSRQEPFGCHSNRYSEPDVARENCRSNVMSFSIEEDNGDCGTSIWQDEADTLSTNQPSLQINSRPLPVGSEPTASSSESLPIGLCDISLISRVSSSSLPREQISSSDYYGDPTVSATESGTLLTAAGSSAGAAFHSTFNYPLHSTLRCTAVHSQPSTTTSRRRHSDMETSSSSPSHATTTLTTCSRLESASPDTGLQSLSTKCTQSWRNPDAVNRQHEQRCPAQQVVATSDYDELDDINGLRRQTGRAVLKRRPAVDDDSDSNVADSRLSLQATCGSIPDLLDLSSTTLDDVISTRVREFVVAASAAANKPSHYRRHTFVDRSQRRLKNGVIDCNGNDVKKCRAVTKPSENVPVCLSNPTGSKQAGRRTNPSLLGYGCLATRNYDNYVTVAMEKERRRRQVAVACRRADMAEISRKRSLVKRLKRFSNILCTNSGATADRTQSVMTLGHF